MATNTNQDKKVASCEITAMPRPMPEGMFDPMPQVKVTYEDGSTETLFEFYPDELSFSPREFVGLTRSQALELRHKKDVAYLRR
jgi:hypothetical protein